MTELEFLKGLISYTEKCDTHISNNEQNLDARRKRIGEDQKKEEARIRESSKSDRDRLEKKKNDKLGELDEYLKPLASAEAALPGLALQYSGPPITDYDEIEFSKLRDCFIEVKNALEEIGEFSKGGALSRKLNSKKINSAFVRFYRNLNTSKKCIAARKDKILEDYYEQLGKINNKETKDIADSTHKGDISRISLTNDENNSKSDITDYLEKTAVQCFPDHLLKDLEVYSVEPDFGQLPMKTNKKFTIGEIAVNLKDYTSYKEVSKVLEKRVSSFCSDGYAYLPQVVDIDKSDGIAVIGGSRCAEHTQDLMKRMNLKILSNVELGDVEFYILDPLNKGRSLGTLLSFNDKTNKVFPRVAYDENSINETLMEIEKATLNIIQQKFKGRYTTIDDYNNDNAGGRIPRKIVDVYDFPAGFTSKSFNCLYDILAHSAGTGLVVNIHFNPDVSVSDRNIDANRLVTLFKKVYSCNGSAFFNASKLPLLLPEPVSDVRVFSFAENYIETLNERDAAPKAVVTLRSVAGDIFKSDSSSRIFMPVGMDSDGNIKKIVFGSELSNHMMITGGTGSGKSSLLHAIILEAMYNFSPEDINLYLLDFKSGVEFKVYDRRDLPHIKLLAVDAIPEFGESILKDLVDELERRSSIFKSAGFSSLPEYVRSTGIKIPRILLIIDEFQSLFNLKADAAVANRCAQYAKEIAAKGRSYGVHMIFSTQTLSVLNEGVSLDAGTVEQMRIRVGLHCSEQDCHNMFGSKAEKAYPLMEGPAGTAVCCMDSHSEPERFQVAYSPGDERKALLEEIAKKASGYTSTIQVFEGSAEYALPDDFLTVDDYSFRIKVGKPIAVAPDIEVSFQKNYCGNTIVATNAADNLSKLEKILMKGITSIDKSTVYLLTSKIAKPIEGESSPNVKKIILEKEIVRTVYELSQEMKRRQDDGCDDPLFIFVSNLQWIRILQDMLNESRVNIPDYLEDMYELDFQQSDATEHFLNLMRNGGAYNMFIIVTTGNCAQMFQRIQRSFVHFNNVIGTNLGEPECEKLFEFGVRTKDKLGMYSDNINGVSMFKIFNP